MTEASRGGKNEEVDFALELPKGAHPANTLILVKPILDF